MATATHTTQNDAANEALIQGALKAILDRSAHDITFRSKLLADSRSALAEFAGVSADSFAPTSFSFIESNADAMIVLPKYQGPRADLSETELETVSGGTEPISLGTIALIGFLAGVDVGLAVYDAGLIYKALK